MAGGACVCSRKMEYGDMMLKCKNIFYISIDNSSFSVYNKYEEREGGHRNEV